MRHYLTYAGTPSTNFGVYISGAGTFNAPERDIKTVAIPGRNGDLTIDNGRYKNIDVEYPAFIAKDYAENVLALRNHLLSYTGYQRLEDTYHPDEYRMARYKGDFEGGATPGMSAGEFQIKFDCMPQRYLKSGEDWISVESGDTIYNPTMQRALPLIKIAGSPSGQATVVLQIGAVQITVSVPLFATMYIDCAMQEAYRYNTSTSMNSNLTLDDGVFPYLDPGDNAISFTSTKTVTMQIQPRWWRL